MVASCSMRSTWHSCPHVPMPGSCWHPCSWAAPAQAQLPRKLVLQLTWLAAGQPSMPQPQIWWPQSRRRCSKVRAVCPTLQALSVRRHQQHTMCVQHRCCRAETAEVGPLPSVNAIRRSLQKELPRQRSSTDVALPFGQVCPAASGLSLPMTAPQLGDSLLPAARLLAAQGDVRI